MNAFERAAETIEPFVHESRDGRVLAPWAEALRCLGHSGEARAVTQSLRALGYVEPGLGRVCEKTSPSMSSSPAALRKDS